jgi:hypothetical protein
MKGISRLIQQSSKLVFLAVCFVSAKSSFGSDLAGTPPLLAGVDAVLTERGIRRLEHDILPLLLKDLGYSLNEGNVPSWSYQSEKSIQLTSLPAEFLKHRATFEDLRDSVGKWLSGFDLQAPQLSLDARGIRYRTQPTQMGVVDLRPGPDGWILGKATVRFQHFAVSADEFTIRDLNNDWLGEASLEEAEIKMLSSNSTDLFASLQFAIRLSAVSGHLEIQVLSFDTNFSDMPVELTFRDIRLPEIRIEVGSAQVRDLAIRLRENVLKHRSTLVSSLQLFLVRYARENLPALLQTDLNFRWRRLMELALDSAPPGGISSDGSIDPFRWISVPSKLEWSSSRGVIDLSWKTGILDLAYPEKNALLHPFIERGRADFSVLGQMDFDLGIAVNPDLVTQAIGLSLQNRQLFGAVSLEDEVGNPSVLRLISPPVFDYDSRSSGRMLKAKIQFGLSKEKGSALYQILFKDSEAVIDAEVWIEVRPRGARSLDFYMSGIELSASQLREDSLKGAAFKRAIIRYVQKQLDLKARDLEKAPQLLTSYELSPSYLGIPVQVSRTAISPSGHVLVALEQLEN